MPVLMEKLPPISTVLGALDLQGQASAREAGDHTVAAVRRALPARTSTVRRAQSRRVTRDGQGFRIEVQPRSIPHPSGKVTAREVTRFVNDGTGRFGPKGRPYGPRRAEAFALPGGWRSGTIQGQKGRHVYERVQRSEEAQVFRILERGSHEAARRMEAVLDG